MICSIPQVEHAFRGTPQERLSGQWLDADLVHGDPCGVRDALPQLMHCKGLLHCGNIVLDGLVHKVNLGKDAYAS